MGYDRNTSNWRPDTLKGDKVRVDIVCKRCQEPRTAFIHQDPRYSSNGAYLGRVFFRESRDQHREFRSPRRFQQIHFSFINRLDNYATKSENGATQGHNNGLNSSNAYVQYLGATDGLMRGTEKELTRALEQIESKRPMPDITTEKKRQRKANEKSTSRDSGITMT